MKRQRESIGSRESFGQQLAHMRLSDLWRWRHPYKRVRMTEHEDIESAYPYICACIEDSSIADGLEELVIGNENWSELNWYDRMLTDENRPARDAREGTHKKILAHVRGLGLSDKVTERMVKALEWKRQIYLGQSPETDDGGVWQNMEFTSAGVRRDALAVSQHHD